MTLRLQAVAPFAVLAAVALGVFVPVLFGGRTMYPTDITNELFLPFAASRDGTHVQVTAVSDYVIHYYPLRDFQASSFREGSLNLWNPRVFGGHPAFASSAGMVAFDPFNLLLLWPDLGVALAWRSFLQVLACMSFMYLYLRHLNLGVAGGLVGAVGYGLNSMFWANVFDWSIAGLLWLPLVCLLLDRAMAVRSLRRTAVAGLIFGIALLASPLQIYVYLCLAIVALVGLQCLVTQRDWRLNVWAKSIAVVPIVLLIGVGMSAVQLLPTLELIGQSARFAGGALRATNKPPRSLLETVFATFGLVSFIFPNLAGRLKDSMMVTRAWGGETHWQGFIGLVPFFLAVMGTIGGVDRRRIPFAILGLSVVGIVLYTPLGPVLYERFFLVYIFCACVLAAFGCRAVCRREWVETRARLSLWLTAVLVAVVVAALIAFNIALLVAGNRIDKLVEGRVLGALAASYLGPSYPSLYLAKARGFIDDARFNNPQTFVPLSVAVAGLSLIALRLQGRVSGRTCGAAAVALTSVDMAFMSLTHVPLVDVRRNPFTPTSEAIRLVQNDHESYRAMSLRVSAEPPVLPAAMSSLYGFETADGYDDLGPPNLPSVVSTSDSPCGKEVCVNVRNSDLANVKYLFTGPSTRLAAEHFELIYDREMRVYRDRQPMARAFWVASYVVVPDTSAAIMRVRAQGFDPRVAVVLDRQPGLTAKLSRDANVAIVDRRPTRVSIRVDAAGPGLLVLSDTFYPGWYAMIDDQPAPVLRANGVMRAVAVTEGHHRVTFRYAPQSFFAGAWISVATACLAFTTFLFGGESSCAF